jgi:hypothetical protein
MQRKKRRLFFWNRIGNRGKRFDKTTALDIHLHLATKGVLREAQDLVVRFDDKGIVVSYAFSTTKHIE